MRVGKEEGEYSGVVPDSMMVLFSGLGDRDKVQREAPACHSSHVILLATKSSSYVCCWQIACSGPLRSVHVIWM